MAELGSYGGHFLEFWSGLGTEGLLLTREQVDSDEYLVAVSKRTEISLTFYN